MAHTRRQDSFPTPVVKGLRSFIESNLAYHMELLFQQNIMLSQIFLMTQVLLRFDEQRIWRYLHILLITHPGKNCVSYLKFLCA